jgi:hypothetical protein
MHLVRTNGVGKVRIIKYTICSVVKHQKQESVRKHRYNMRCV